MMIMASTQKTTLKNDLLFFSKVRFGLIVDLKSDGYLKKIKILSWWFSFSRKFTGLAIVSNIVKLLP